ncbi:MAG TPA: DAK2 domain-containing protein [Aggregatilineales bacterium]|nr:DAK2 domain-containing protein [Chloroflexota bacterium]HOA24434.1 DAK2 domain-containing protein [Aggregatilineales bacterium]HPV06236.1 DAK2 domain-containing protein [Aggregatilineales bacterium]
MAESTVSGAELRDAIRRVVAALKDNSDRLTELDQAMGDGDLGITAKKIANGLETYIDDTAPDDDLGKYVMTAGMKVNSAAPSTMGTLIASGLMRAGREAKGRAELDGATLAAMFRAAVQGIQERGKAKPGDKTLIDALHPAAEAFAEAVERGDGLQAAAREMVAAAEKGLESVTPLQSRIGRAGWVGERTQGKVDPGCAFAVVVLRALAGMD